jgi:hypothetical protein
MNLIDKQEVRLIESDADAYPQEWNDDYEKGFCDAIHKVLELPTIDAQPVKRGRWIPMDEYHAKCSVCGWWQKTNGKCCTGNANIHNAVYKYCTVCGAKMGGNADGNGND